MTKNVCFLIPVKEDNRIVTRIANLSEGLKDSDIANSRILVIKDDELKYKINEQGLPKNCVVSVKKNPGKVGKGSAVKFGLSLVQEEIICIIDSDESISVEDVIKSCEVYERGSFLYGVRLYLNSTEKIRRVLGITQNLFANLISLKGYIQDTQCPLKVFDQDVRKSILKNMTISGGMYDVQLFKIIQKKNIALSLYPAIRIDEDTSTLRLRNIILRDFFDLIRIKFSKVL